MIKDCSKCSSCHIDETEVHQTYCGKLRTILQNKEDMTIYSKLCRSM